MAEAADEYVVRLAAPSDAPGILRTLQAAFDSWPEPELSGSALEHLEWKLDNLGGADARATVATLHDEVVAAHLRWAAAATLDETPVSVNHTIDIAVDPAHRGHALTRRSDDHDLELGIGGEIGVDLISKSDAVKHIYEGGERVHRPMHTWRRPIGLRRAVIESLGHAPRHLVAAMRRRRAPSLLAALAPAGVVIEEISTFDRRADELWAAARGRFRFELVRDARFVNWRHADPRSGARTIFGMFASAAGASPRSAESPLVGWAVLRPHRAAMRVADFLVHPDYEAVAPALLERCALAATEAGAASLETWLPEDHPAEQWFRAAGFAPSGEPFLCQFWITWARKAEFSLIEPLADPDASFHVTMGDFDFA